LRTACLTAAEEEAVILDRHIYTLRSSFEG
jgi:hypothetical protein